MEVAGGREHAAKGSSLSLSSALTPPLCGILPHPGISDTVVQAQGVTAVSYRTHWNHIYPVALFVEHVLLGVESQIPELQALVTDYVFLLNKVSARAGPAQPAAYTCLLPGCRTPRRHRTFIHRVIHSFPAEGRSWECRGG